MTFQTSSQGKTGLQGKTGPRGFPGFQGKTGPQGENGQPGQDAEDMRWANIEVPIISCKQNSETGKWEPQETKKTIIQTTKITLKTAAGDRTITRLQSQGSYRERSVKLIFDKPRKVGKSTGTYKSVSLPLASGCTVTDAVRYFQKQGPALGIAALTTPAGKTIRWGKSK